MAEDKTLRCGLPLLLPAQAQKHVTVNDALMRLDGLLNLTLQSATVSAPPAAVIDGQCWGVPAGAVNAWEGRGGQVAIGANGGWVFASPQFGQRAWIADQGGQAVWDGAGWVGGALNLGLLGGAMIGRMIEGVYPVVAGSGANIDMTIPANVMVIGITARVAEAINGTATSWQLGHAPMTGVTNASSRFGSGLGTALGSYSMGLLSTPTSFYTPMQMKISASGGNFGGAGKVRISAHWLELRIPSMP